MKLSPACLSLTIFCAQGEADRRLSFSFISSSIKFDVHVNNNTGIAIQKKIFYININVIKNVEKIWQSRRGQ